MKFHENLSNGSELFLCTDGQTDMTELIDENCAPLSYYAASNAIYLPTFRDNLSVPFQGVLENGTDWLSRKAGKELPLLAAY
jgi:hypothetical protein